MTDTEGNLIYSAKDGRYYYIVYEGDAFAPGGIVGTEDSRLRDSSQQDVPQRVNTSMDLDTLREKLTELRNVLAEFDISMLTEDGAAAARRDYPDDYSYNTNVKDPLHEAWVWIDSGNLPANPPKAATCSLLVLKISFADIKCLFDDNAWHKRIFDDGVSDYYTKVSNGKFTYVAAQESFSPQDGNGGVNDGVIHITLPIDRPEYRHYNIGDNFSNGARVGIYPVTVDGKELEFALVNDASLIAYALKYADAYIDFSQYDRNGDGFISPTELAVMAVVAGYEAAMGAAGDMPRTWAHSYQFNTWRYAQNEASPTGERAVIGNAGCVELDGKKLYKYTAIGENINISYDYGAPPLADNPPVQATIGTPCHELGHDLGLMDLYDPTYSPQEAEVLTLSLMGDGNHGSDLFDPSSRPGSSPTILDPYSKIFLGFYDATVVTEGGLYYLTAASDYANYNILRINTDDPNIYYLVENRTMNGYDLGLRYYSEQELYTGGLVYWRINQAVTDANWESNTVNATSGNYGIMPVHVTFSNVDGDYTGTNPFQARQKWVFP